MPFIGLDREGRIQRLNAAAAEWFAGLRAHPGRTLAEIFGDDAPIVELARRASSGDVAEHDVVIAGPGFAMGRANIQARAVGDGGFVALTLQPAPRLRAPSPGAQPSAARTLAHEVRNPLAGIRAAAQLMEREGGPSSTLARLICDEVDRINRLTDKIDPAAALDVARFAAFNVHEALERVRALVASSAPSLQIREQYDPSLPAIRGDRDQIIQAFLNIAKNAAEAMAGQPNARLTFVTLFRPGVRVRTSAVAAARPQLEVQIVDNGPGIAPAIAERLFEAFTTTKPGGMGLGLNVAADIIGRHDGRIEVDSAPGRTAFKILLPIEAEENP